jgi:uncharacterized protein (TIGR03083 family)
VSADSGSDQAVAEKSRVVELLGQEWAVIGDLLAGLSDQDWSREALPGWDVHDVLAHIIGTEKTLSGAQLPSAPAAMSVRTSATT